MKVPSIGIFIPAYNAAATLDGVLNRIPTRLWENVVTLVIVDDGSTDGTAIVAKAWASRKIVVHLHSFEKNRGYGAAVRHGLAVCKEAGCDIVVCLHADGQYPPERIQEFAEHMITRGIGLLQGSRLLDGGALAGGMPLYKYVAGKLLTRLGNICLGHKLTDPHSGFLCYSRRLVESIPMERLSGYFDFDMEVIACALAAGMRVEELAIPAHYGAELSYLNPVRYGFRVLWVAARYRAGYYRRLTRH